MIAERLIGPKTNEVPEFAPLLRELNERAPLAGHVITIDAGHTVRAHAPFICEELAAHYVMTVKGNTPRLFDALDSLGWAAVPVSHIRAMLPHVRQVFLIERYARPATPRSPPPPGRSSMTPACSWPSSACQAQYEQQK